MLRLFTIHVVKLHFGSRLFFAASVHCGITGRFNCGLTQYCVCHLRLEQGLSNLRRTQNISTCLCFSLQVDASSDSVAAPARSEPETLAAGLNAPLAASEVKSAGKEAESSTPPFHPQDPFKGRYGLPIKQTKAWHVFNKNEALTELPDGTAPFCAFVRLMKGNEVGKACLGAEVTVNSARSQDWKGQGVVAMLAMVGKQYKAWILEKLPAERVGCHRVSAASISEVRAEPTKESCEFADKHMDLVAADIASTATKLAPLATDSGRGNSGRKASSRATKPRAKDPYEMALDQEAAARQDKQASGRHRGRKRQREASFPDDTEVKERSQKSRRTQSQQLASPFLLPGYAPFDECFSYQSIWLLQDFCMADVSATTVASATTTSSFASNAAKWSVARVGHVCASHGLQIVTLARSPAEMWPYPLPAPLPQQWQPLPFPG